MTNAAMTKTTMAIYTGPAMERDSFFPLTGFTDRRNQSPACRWLLSGDVRQVRKFLTVWDKVMLQIKTALMILFVAAGLAAAVEPALSQSQIASDWSQWRGPDRNGKVESKSPPWPDSIGQANLKVTWRTPLGPSYSGPLVIGDLVYVTETVGQRDEFVRCLDRKTGQQKWEVNWTGSMKVPFFASANGSWIRSTPAYSEGKIYVGGIRDILVCIDADSGQIVWRKDFPAINNTPIPMFGCVCSPLVDGSFVYMQAGGAMHKLDKNTGQVVWQTVSDGIGKNSSVFSSPTIETIAGDRQLLETGQVLWDLVTPAFRGMSIITPTVFDDRLMISNYQHPTTMFVVEKKSPQQFEISERWKNKARGYMTTPVIIKGHAFTFLQNERFACIDLATGEIKWSSDKFAKYASLVANRDRILALTSDGDLVLYAANVDRFELLGRHSVATDAWAHLAVSGDEVFVRAIDGLIALKWN